MDFFIKGSTICSTKDQTQGLDLVESGFKRLLSVGSKGEISFGGSFKYLDPEDALKTSPSVISLGQVAMKAMKAELDKAKA